jgi:hypothetical protein
MEGEFQTKNWIVIPGVVAQLRRKMRRVVFLRKTAEHKVQFLFQIFSSKTLRKLKL